MGSLIARKKQILMNSPHIETVSGNIADFTTDLRAKLKSCKIEFLPVQEGSGDPSPTNIRPISGYTSLNISQSGENLLPAGSYTREQNGITFTYYENGDIHIEGKATGNAFLNVPTSMYFTITPGTYTLSGNRSDSNVNMYFVVSSANGGDIKWNMIETNTPKTRTIDFTDSSARIQISVVSGKTVNTTIHPRIERGSTATPVTTTPVAFNLAGNNLFEKSNSNVLDCYISTNKIIYFADTKLVYIKCKPSTTYIISKTAGQRFSVGYTIDLPATNVAVYEATLNHTGSSITYTTGSDAEYLVAFVYNVNYDMITAEEMVDSVQIKQYSNTIYGGYVDLVNGRVVAEYKAFTAKVSDANIKTEYDGINLYRFSNIIDEDCVLDNRQKCSIAIYAWSMNSYKADHFYVYTSTDPFYKTNLLLYLLTPVDETQEFTVVIPLETPIEYQIPLQDLKSIKGINNIWSSNNGNTTVKFWTH